LGNIRRQAVATWVRWMLAEDKAPKTIVNYLRPALTDLREWRGSSR